VAKRVASRRIAARRLPNSMTMDDITAVKNAMSAGECAMGVSVTRDGKGGATGASPAPASSSGPWEPSRGDIVWAKLGAFPWWPAQVIPLDLGSVINAPNAAEEHQRLFGAHGAGAKGRAARHLVYFFGEASWDFLPKKSLRLYNPSKKSDMRALTGDALAELAGEERKNFGKGVLQANEVLSRRQGVVLRDDIEVLDILDHASKKKKKKTPARRTDGDASHSKERWAALGGLEALRGVAVAPKTSKGRDEVATWVSSHSKCFRSNKIRVQPPWELTEKPGEPRQMPAEHRRPAAQDNQGEAGASREAKKRRVEGPIPGKAQRPAARGNQGEAGASGDGAGCLLTDVHITFLRHKVPLTIQLKISAERYGPISDVKRDMSKSIAHIHFKKATDAKNYYSRIVKAGCFMIPPKDLKVSLNEVKDRPKEKAEGSLPLNVDHNTLTKAGPLMMPPKDSRVSPNEASARPKERKKSENIVGHQGVQVGRSNIPCKYYMKGCCMRGGKCHFAHVDNTQAANWDIPTENSNTYRDRVMQLLLKRKGQAATCHDIQGVPKQSKEKHKKLLANYPDSFQIEHFTGGFKVSLTSSGHQIAEQRALKWLVDTLSDKFPGMKSINKLKTLKTDELSCCQARLACMAWRLADMFTTQRAT